MVDFEFKKRYIKWYRLAQQTINDEKIAPKLMDEQIMHLVSGANWLPVASPDLVNRDDVKNSPHPNIYISLDEDEPEITVGVVFNTVRSIDRIRRSILTPYSAKEKEELIQLLHALGKNYRTSVWKKIHDYRWDQTPKYEPLDPPVEVSTNKIDAGFIERVFKAAGEIRVEGLRKSREKKALGKFYRENPVIGLAEITMPLDEGEFRSRIKELTKILNVCTRVKTEVEIKKIRKGEAMQIKELQEEKRRLEQMINLPYFSEKARKRLEEVNKELKELETRRQDVVG